MGMRELAEDIKRQQYFEAVPTPEPEQDEGTRELGVLYPFLISGGSNTERYYFTHINDTTEYRFNIRPRYFGDESSYTEAFPKRIQEILSANNEAKIFCVFDWDTVYGNETRLKNHADFVAQFAKEIADGTVTICPSMPSIEYWFLLHFEDYTKLLRDYPAVSNKLAPWMRPCFSKTGVALKKLLKTEKYLKEPTWVENLCAEGKLVLAIERAEKNIAAAVEAGKLEEQSYSFVYKVFKKDGTKVAMERSEGRTEKEA